MNEYVCVYFYVSTNVYKYDQGVKSHIYFQLKKHYM